jgi:hypothetical protein
MRAEYETWFTDKFGCPPMAIDSRQIDFCWQGYQAGVASTRQQLAERDNQIESLKASLYGLYELEKEAGTAWAQAHRLALELECLIMDTKDNATVSKWWDSAFEAIEEYNKLKPGAAEDAEAWAKMRKAGI